MTFDHDGLDIATAFVETLKLTFRGKSNFRHKFSRLSLSEVPLHHTKQRMMSKSVNQWLFILPGLFSIKSLLCLGLQGTDQCRPFQ